MCTQFVELEMALLPVAELVPAIEQELGDALRWAITKVEADKVTVEAAILVEV
jgi:hypothetical protein